MANSSVDVCDFAHRALRFRICRLYMKFVGNKIMCANHKFDGMRQCTAQRNIDRTWNCSHFAVLAKLWPAISIFTFRCALWTKRKRRKIPKMMAKNSTFTPFRSIDKAYGHRYSGVHKIIQIILLQILSALSPS